MSWKHATFPLHLSYSWSGFSRKFKTCIRHECTTNVATIISTCQKLRELYFLIVRNSRSNEEIFLQTHLRPVLACVINGSIWLRSAINKGTCIPLEGCLQFILCPLNECNTNVVILFAIGQKLSFTRTALGFFGCISASFPMVFLKIRTAWSPRMNNKLCKFGCDWSKIKVAYSAVCHFGYISNFVGGIFLKTIPRILHSCHINATSLVPIGQKLKALYSE